MAGGRSRRLGQDKALLTAGGETLLARTVRRLGEVAAEILVMGPAQRSAQAPGTRVIPDTTPGEGPLPALAAALATMRGERLVAVATDMPFLNTALLTYLVERSVEYDVVVPCAGGRTQQLHAVYSRACLPFIEEQLAVGDRKIGRFFPRVRTLIVEEEEVRRLDPDLRSFCNINTVEDWQAAAAILAREEAR